MEMIRYEAACRAVAEAKTFDDVKEIVNVAEAARAYARQAKNKDLELDAVEIRVRAERRLGEMLLSLRKDGQFGQGRCGSPIHLADMGIDPNISAPAQRLAMLPVAKFENEISDWRKTTPRAGIIHVPLQTYRRPTIVGDRQKAASRNGVKRINYDALDRFKAPDGRRVADWRFGELERIEQLAVRVLHCVDALFANMKVANPDPFATMEMLFQDDLELILNPIWDVPVKTGDAGIERGRIDRAKEARMAKYKRRCERCGTEFIMRRPSGKALRGESNEGRFCSRVCRDAGV